jgi:hypothetical protein
MSPKVGVWIGVLLLVVVMAIASFVAQGAPSAPGISLSGQYNPAITQQMTISLTSQIYSTQSLNTVSSLGAKFVVTVTQGTSSILYQHQYAAGFLGYSSPGNPLSAQVIGMTVTVTIPAACSSVCPTENLTVSAYAIAQGVVGLSSPTTTVVFTPTQQSAAGVAAAPANYASYALGFWTPVLIAIAAISGAIYWGVGKHPIAGLVTVVATVALIAEVGLALAVTGVI